VAAAAAAVAAAVAATEKVETGEAEANPSKPMESKPNRLGLLIVPRLMLAATFVVAALHVIVLCLTGHPENYSWRRDLFDMGAEANVPTWLASIFWFTIAIFAVLLFVQAAGRSKWRRLPWLLVAAVFCGASCDEISEIHEHVGDILQRPMVATGNPEVLRQGSPGSPWILFYAPFLALTIFGMVYFFYKNLAKRYFLLTCAGFFCFVLAIGCDWYQGMWEPTKIQIAQNMHVDPVWLVDASIVVEETLELIGMTFIAWALIGKYEMDKKIPAQAPGLQDPDDEITSADPSS
jgi:hypothetical protein